eukprot:TRINITY_DN1661_c0_g1_i2.p1 TRINITY_DN1661_c0_g1~~TRINITY_DN1661_c0_g1_i2.p1  ORF type:complete len:132 (-),score=20.91 TRINITY_DN1661_c0_g1_i2:116-511(-)
MAPFLPHTVSGYGPKKPIFHILFLSLASVSRVCALCVCSTNDALQFDCGGGGFSYLGVLFESPKHLGSGDLIYINTDKANRDGATAGTGSFWVSGDSIRLKLDETFPSASKFSALGKPLPRSVFEGHPVAL